MTAPVRILVVDDEPDVEALVTQKFRREIRKKEMEFVFAHDGQEALDLLETDRDVLMVLSDINMPRMDGLTLLTHLDELHRELKTVVVSAYGDMDNIRTAMNRGAFDFVTKPIEFDDLEATIRKTLLHLDEFRTLQREKAEAELARATLSRYFSPSVVNSLAQDANLMKPGGDRREATFLFTDLTGFTKLVESTDPDIIVELLNRYIDGVARIVFANDGTVMKIIGDAVQATFGAPVAQSDHAARAVKSALEIDAFAEEFRSDWNARGIALGTTRIGVNSGEAIIGNFGGESFFDYTAYGDAVNTAARLESANKVLGTRICVGVSVAGNIAEFSGRPAGFLLLPGKLQSLESFEPLPPEIGASGQMEAYRKAYAQLASGDPAAKQSLAALMAELPDDPLTLFHLQRALGGATDTIVEISGK
ncbi:MAG: adenylate/guanylate cyclase domain-containing protein [Antarcticimicrobium sp.]|uniref:adenylate/guanylate cyclase domain-containing protein n=1 Tax=Antarcticimicrobium sp. TaxID=2824147 RepID=UPI002602B0F9|nr:adenylate/guanylate cyclase domain-containing protein [Antarcticimicrobium sp.]MDF1715760.1 adenylate/guanylate cyclase domain-containing protein [Antarcticimicrobium sp.]